ncbi:MmyB family transcriptional regulator [Williamsia muralis]|uniref:MmyB family transcriptional regulator n=1 Tax=Williamsia marianensis TaxID=85044 RepID=UPI000DE78328|nr:hypothetical protein [Williamsia marianensis]PVY33744.1 hypothetical protein C7458_101143 [Williamsia marianensis]
MHADVSPLPDSAANRKDLSHAVEDVVNRLPNTPAVVVDGIGNILAANALAGELFSEFVIRDNIVRMAFLDPAAHHDEDSWRSQARDSITTLRCAYQRSPDHVAASRLVSELLRSSESFRTMWIRRAWTRRPDTPADGGDHTHAHRVYRHPEMGTLVVDEVALASAAEQEKRVLVYVPVPGSASDDALRILGTLRARI